MRIYPALVLHVKVGKSAACPRGTLKPKDQILNFRLLPPAHDCRFASVAQHSAHESPTAMATQPNLIGAFAHRPKRGRASSEDDDTSAPKKLIASSPQEEHAKNEAVYLGQTYTGSRAHKARALTEFLNCTRERMKNFIDAEVAPDKEEMEWSKDLINRFKDMVYYFDSREDFNAALKEEVAKRKENYSGLRQIRKSEVHRVMHRLKLASGEHGPCQKGCKLCK